MINKFNISSQNRYELVDITDQVEKVVRKNSLKEGLVLVFVPHSTAAILLTENEQGLKKDFSYFLKELISGFDFEHNKIDNNADSHILAGFIGQERVLPVKEGRIIRGTWQQIFLVELDGPRSRTVIVKTVKS